MRHVICSNQIAATGPVGQAVKTPPFHNGNMGSIPVRVTKPKKSRRESVCFFVCRRKPGGVESYFSASKWDFASWKKYFSYRDRCFFSRCMKAISCRDSRDVVFTRKNRMFSGTWLRMWA